MWLVWIAAGVLLTVVLNQLLGKPLPFLRWSVIRLGLGMGRFLREWQVGDGREEEAGRYVIEHAPAGDVDAAIAAIDRFAYQRKILVNVGDEKGAILDRVVERVKPRRVLELGAYVGYSALRIARRLPAGAVLHSVEINAANAAIARRVIEHAGLADRVHFIVGSLGDSRTMERLKELFAPASLDLVFIDHAKDLYLPDLKRILEAGWLHPGSVVVADNVRFPGAPAYRAFMEAAEGNQWRSIAHDSHAEYQRLIPDVVLESTLL